MIQACTSTRRQLLRAALGALATACAPSRITGPSAPAHGSTSAARELAAIEARVGGRLGVFALDTGSDRHVAHRPDERFAMCSTFKWLLAAAILSRVDRGQLSLDERVRYGQADLIDHAPVTSTHVGEGAMSIDALTAAAVIESDNTAANLLLAKIGGPAGLTSFARALGDPVTRLDRNELSLNDNDADDPRDTTSPRAMTTLMRVVLCGDALTPPSRERLSSWLRACATGKDRIRAGLPPSWAAGDKTGTGQRGAVNDVAIAWPHGRAPILVAVYMSDSDADFRTLVAAHAEVGKLVARELSGAAPKGASAGAT